MDVEQRRDEKNEREMNEEEVEEVEVIKTTLLRKNRKRWVGNDDGIVRAATVVEEEEEEEEKESVGDIVEMGHRKNAYSDDDDQEGIPAVDENDRSRRGGTVASWPVSPENFEEDGSCGSSGSSEVQTHCKQITSFVGSKPSVEIALETLLTEQDEYDLFCPNCNSCITKRVILRKRKRTAGREIIEVKGEKIQIQTQPVKPDVIADIAIPVEQAEGQDDTEDERELFRCLSCFSFFIPSGGGGFKLFDLFGKKDKNASAGSQPVQSDNSTVETEPDRAVRVLSDPEPVAADGIGKTEPKIIKPVQQVPIPKPVQQVPKTLPGSSRVAEETVINIGEFATPDAGRIPQQDILKPIVYGGLIETIISFTVVSSAAGAGVSTVNIVALALACLMSGLVLKLHDIWEMHEEEYYHHQSKDTRYWRLLGRRSHFKLNTAVALLSFILAGILPVAIYWVAQPWMFRMSSSDVGKYCKLVATGVASVVLIGLLSVGKAHVQSPPKTYLKTCSKYLGIVLSSSVTSFASGVLIEKLLTGVLVPLEPHSPDLTIPSIQYSRPRGFYINKL